VTADESTTPDLVELSRHGLEAGLGDLDEGLRFFSSDAVWEVPALGVSLEGSPAIRAFLEDWLSAFDQFEINLEEILDLGNGVVFATARTDGLPLGGAGSARLREVFVYVVTWVNGKIMRVTVYNDIGQARAAAQRLAEERG
jgi:ketosteroid isomerase-like protein